MFKLQYTPYCTDIFRRYSVTINAIDLWNKMKHKMGEIASKDLRPNKIKWVTTEKFIKSYELIHLFKYVLFILCDYPNGYHIII